MEKVFLNPDDAVCSQHALMLLDYLNEPGEVHLDEDHHRVLKAQYGLTRQEVKQAVNLLAKHCLVTVTTDGDCVLVSLPEMGRGQRSGYSDIIALMASKSADHGEPRSHRDKEDV